jgi:diacylglycerol kinase
MNSMQRPAIPPTSPKPTEPSGLPDPAESEWTKFIKSFHFAFSGLWHAIRTQRNMRVHLLIALLAIIAGILLHISAVEFALVFVAITGVFIAEMFNTVFELAVDLASPEYHPLAKIAKDVSAGAVLLSAILSIVIGLFVYVPHLWALFVK